MPVGSSGDVHPFVGLGLALKRRGHSVTLITNGYFQPLAERVWIAVCRTRNCRQVSRDSEESRISGIRPSRYKRFSASSCRTSFGKQYERARRSRRNGDNRCCGIAGHRSANRSGEARPEAHHGPFAASRAAQLCRAANTRAVRIAALAAGLVRPRLFRVARPIDRRSHRRADDRAVATRAWLTQGPKLLRRVVELAPACARAMFPEWFAPAPDYPPQLRFGGFPLYDERIEHELPADVQRFLDAANRRSWRRSAPGCGSAHLYFAAVADACRILNRRGILLTPHAEQIPHDAARRRRALCLCAVQHAVAARGRARASRRNRHLRQGMAAGVPQIVMPLAHDQPDNARRLCDSASAGR